MVALKHTKHVRSLDSSSSSHILNETTSSFSDVWTSQITVWYLTKLFDGSTAKLLWLQATPSCQVLNKRELCATHLTQRRDGTQSVHHCAAFCTAASSLWVLSLGREQPSPLLKGREQGGTKPGERFVGVGQVRPAWCWQTTSWQVCVGGESHVVHVCQRGRGKHMFLCLNERGSSQKLASSLSILNPSPAPSQFWLLVEKLLSEKQFWKNSPPKPGSKQDLFVSPALEGW